MADEPPDPSSSDCIGLADAGSALSGVFGVTVGRSSALVGGELGGGALPER